MSEHAGSRPQAAPGQPPQIYVVLDQYAGAVRRRAEREGSQIIGVDLFPATEALLRAAEECGVAVAVLMPDLRNTDTQRQLVQFLAPIREVLALDALVELRDRNDSPPDPTRHSRLRLLPAQTRRWEEPPGSAAMSEATAVRRRLSSPRARRAHRYREGPGRTPGGDYKVQRGQLNPLLPTLRTSHFPNPPIPTLPTRHQDLLNAERRR